MFSIRFSTSSLFSSSDLGLSAMSTDPESDADTLPDFLSPRLLQAIGSLVVHWAYLENTAEIAIWCLLDLDDERGPYVTTHMGMVSRVNVIRQLFRQKIPENKLRSLIEETLDKIKPLRIERNNIVHSMWKCAPGSDETETLKVSARGELKLSTAIKTAAEVEATTHRVFRTVDEIQTMIEVIFPNAHVPWPRIDHEEDMELNQAPQNHRSETN